MPLYQVRSSDHGPNSEIHAVLLETESREERDTYMNNVYDTATKTDRLSARLIRRACTLGGDTIELQRWNPDDPDDLEQVWWVWGPPEPAGSCTVQGTHTAWTGRRLEGVRR